MLIAQDTRVPVRPLGRPTTAITVSAALHAGMICLFLLRPGGRALPDSMPPIEIEMVEQMPERQGASQPPPSSSAAPAAPQPPGPATAPPASPSARPQASPQPPQSEVNLGNSTQDLSQLSVTGDNVVPPGPDTRYRNLPPRYPASAAKSGAEGTVQLLARIAANGLPLSVGVVESSGNIQLDEEARRAVLLWRFRPAREGGRAVAYDYVLNIRFALGDR